MCFASLPLILLMHKGEKMITFIKKSIINQELGHSNKKKVYINQLYLGHVHIEELPPAVSNLYNLIN